MNETTISLAGIAKHFESLPDPRHPRNIHHLLIDVIVIAVCGVIVGCKGPTSIERWAKCKEEWLRSFLISGFAQRHSLAGLYSPNSFGTQTRSVSEMFSRMDCGMFARRRRFASYDRHRRQDAPPFARQSSRPGSVTHRQCLGERRRLRVGTTGDRRKVERNHGDFRASRSNRRTRCGRHHRCDGLSKSGR